MISPSHFQLFFTGIRDGSVRQLYYERGKVGFLKLPSKFSWTVQCWGQKSRGTGGAIISDTLRFAVLNTGGIA